MIGRVLSSSQGLALGTVEVMVNDRLETAKVSGEVGSEVAPGDVVRLSIEADRGFRVLAVLSRAPTALDPGGDVFRWRRPTAGASRMARLWQRQHVLRVVRDDLFEQGFLEVEVPLLVPGACPDAHLDVIAADSGYLVTSTEYQLKRLLVGGFDRLFSLTRNFRAHERGRYHSSEFTMLEWARAGASMREIEDDAVRFIRRAFRALSPDATTVQVGDHVIDLVSRPWERLTVREAFVRHLGLTVAGFTYPALIGAVREAALSLPPDVLATPDLLLSYLLDRVQSFLGTSVPTFLTEWPASMTSSALLQADDVELAERSELYIGGIEIADGFPFLRDPATQRALFTRELERRRAEGKPAVPLDERYVRALEQGIPPGAGMALGFDRLALVLTGGEQLSDVQTFAWDEL